MNHDLFPIDQRNLRGTDSNSLLRMYDRANEVFNSSLLRQKREVAEKAIERIARELEKRNVPL